MPDALETAALNGSLFSFQEGPPSPTRSTSTASPTPSHRDLNTDDEEAEELISSRGEYVGQHARPSRSNGKGQKQGQLVHDGPQTGVKGVVADKKVAASHARELRDKEVQERNIELSRRGIVGLTVNEEDLLRAREDEGLEEWRLRRRNELIRQRRDHFEEEQNGRGDGDGDGQQDRYKRGGLRELGKEGFVHAVEQAGWVVVLIYEPGIPRCNAILASLLHLSLNLPSNLRTPTALYRARAKTLAFSLLPPTSSHSADAVTYGEDDDEVPTGEPDPDVLPSILAYKDGELEKTWIRVDWEVAEDGVEGLLKREGILLSAAAMGDLGANRRDLLALSDDDE